MFFTFGSEGVNPKVRLANLCLNCGLMLDKAKKRSFP